MPKIILDGQEIYLAEEQCVTDEILTNTLLPYYPAIGGAKIQREGDTIRIVKTVGTKGNISIEDAILAEFKEANTSINSALQLTWQIKYLEIQQQLEIADLLNLQPQIQAAIDKGEEAISQIHDILNYLKETSAISSSQSMFI